ncbi:hypothetical protein GQ44DRAFT_721436 [Phaeosphaeriaceae sp. PMI808]|nr:hypothetical protein GQ44DRAFT_721436 [Phaeosphaeriaceae sp. PMI808]
MQRTRRDTCEDDHVRFSNEAAEAYGNVVKRSRTKARMFRRYLDQKRVMPLPLKPIDMVSNPRVVSVTPDCGILAHLRSKSNKTWQGQLKVARTREYVDQISTTAYSSFDDEDGLSTTTQDGEGGRSIMSGTDGTSSLEGGDVVLHGALKDLRKALEIKTGDNEALQAEYGLTRTKLQEVKQRHATLQIKHAEQRKQRQSDYQKVTYAYEQWQETEDRCAELEQQVEILQNHHNDMETALQAQLSLKEEQILQLKSPENGVIAMIMDAHKKELAAKELEVEQAKQLVKEKDEELLERIRKADQDKADSERKHHAAMAEVLKASSTNRKALVADKERLEFEMNIQRVDCADAIARFQATIKRVVGEKDQMIKEHKCMKELLITKFSRVSGLQKVFRESEATKDEMKTLRKQVSRFRTDNEGLLDKMQQNGDHLHRQQEDARTARVDAGRLETKVHNLEDMLLQYRNRICNAVSQIEQLQRGNAEARTHCSVLQDMEHENERLRDLLLSERLAKEKVQENSDKLDSENFNLCITNEKTEEELNDLKVQFEIQKRTSTVIMQELEAYRAADTANGRFTMPVNMGQIFANLRRATKDTESVQKENAKLSKELSEIRVDFQKKEERLFIDYQNLEKVAEFYQNAYFNETLETIANLNEELHALKAENGGWQYVESEQPRNQRVANRNILRVAWAINREGMHANALPQTLLESGADLTSFPVSFAALRVLRPQGWALIYEAGKIWLKPGFSVLSEDDARLLNQAQDRDASREEAGVNNGRLESSTTAASRSAMFSSVSAARPHTNAEIAERYRLPAAPCPPQYRSSFEPHFGESYYAQLDSGNKWDLLAEHLPERIEELQAAGTNT